MNFMAHVRLGLVMLCWLWAASAQAHLMVAQKGTLNLQGEGAYMVVSLPVSAFQGVDDDGDGAWSVHELDLHGPQIHAQVAQQMRLRDSQGIRPIEGVTLIPTPPDDRPNDPVTQLVVLARFKLAHPVDSHATETVSGLHLHAGLFGQHTAEQQLSFTVTQGAHKQLMVLTPERAEQALFPPAWRVVTDFVQLGVHHIATGWDHLLFLAVVLLGGGSWRQILGILSAFTAGHALTLAWGLWGDLPFSSRWVEAGIAGSIVFMAAWEANRRHRQKQLHLRWRLLLVWVCAMVHGLGLASNLLALGLDPAHRLWSLLGFNLGVELGQCAVALAAAGLWVALSRRISANAMARLRSGCLAAALFMGLVWMIERLL